MPDKSAENLARIRACDADWNENDHPRADNGQFTSGSGGGGAKVSKLQSGGKAKVQQRPKIQAMRQLAQAAAAKPAPAPAAKPTLQKLQQAMHSSSMMGDRAWLHLDGQDYVKIGRDKWEHHPSNSHALGGTYSSQQMMEKIGKAKKVDLYEPSAPAKPQPKAAKATLEKARPGIRQMRADKLGYKKLTGEKASNHPEGEAHNMMVGAMESAGGDFYTAKNKLLNNPRISQEVKNAVKKMKAPAGAKPTSMDGLVQHYIDKGDNERASIAIQLRMEMMDGHDLRGAVHNLLSKYDEAEDKGWMDRESYDKNVDMLLNEVSGDAYSALNPAKEDLY